jgi:hypothetical protein
MGRIALIVVTRDDPRLESVSPQVEEKLLSAFLRNLMQRGQMPMDWRLEHVRVLED